MAFLVILGLAGAARQPVFAQEEILSFLASIDVEPNGDLQVLETITVRAEGKKIRRGIFRDFPTLEILPSGLVRKHGFDVIAIRRDGAPSPFHTEKVDGGVRVYIGSASRMLPAGTYTYEIHYRTDRQIRFYESHDELAWNVTGNFWDFPILQAETRITLPQAVQIERYSAYTGALGEQGSDFEVTEVRGNRFQAATTKPLPRHHGFTVAIGFGKGAISTAAGNAGGYWRDNLGLAVLASGTLLVALSFLAVWAFVGRDPARGVIIPRFRPPEGYSAEAVSFLHFWGFRKGIGDNVGKAIAAAIGLVAFLLFRSPKAAVLIAMGAGFVLRRGVGANSNPTAFSAALISLAVKGRIRITDETGEMAVERVADAPDIALSSGEATLERALFGSRHRTEFKPENRYYVERALNGLEIAVRTELEEKLIRNNRSVFCGGMGLSALVFLAFLVIEAPPFSNLKWLLAALAGGTVALLLLLLGAGRFASLLPGGSPSWRNAIMAIVGLTILAAMTQFITPARTGMSPYILFLILVLIGLNLVFLHLLRAPTVAGRSTLDEIEGLRMYLSVAEAERMNMSDAPQVTPGLFEKLLPYAIALDVEEPWSKALAAHLRRIGERPGSYQPSWCSGRSSMVRSGGISNGLTTSLASSLATQSSGASMLGGGGSSGGGGGGGGGGGW